MANPSPVPPAAVPVKQGFGTLVGSLFRVQARPDEMILISHSTMFYWWPVWLCGFILAGVTYFHDTHMVFVPARTQVVKIKSAETLDGKTLKEGDLHALIPGKDRDIHGLNKFRDDDSTLRTPYMHTSKTPGIMFCIVLLLTAVITNTPLRGLWSVIVLMVIVLTSITLAVAGWWDPIVQNFNLLAIHINMAGYLTLSLVLFLVWCFNFFFLDRQMYVIVGPGQVRIHLEIGGGETAYDATGIVFQKLRSDLFRHWILGFGSGDLLVRPAGGKEPIELHNVLSVGRRIRDLEAFLHERQVVAQTPKSA